MGVVGPTYTYAQLEAIWIANGGSAAAAPIAAAVAMAESGGGANSFNNNSNGTQDRGLWQINTVHGSQSTFDPNANARAAIAISNNGSDWSAWTTFTSGAYRQFLQSGVSPNNSGLPTGATPVGFGIPNPFNIGGDIAGAIGKGIGDAIAALLKPFVEIAIWVTESVVGIGLMAAGAFIILQDSKTVRHAEADVAKVGAVSVGAPEAIPGIEAAETESDRVIEGRKQRKAAQTALPAPTQRKRDSFAATGEPLTDWGFGPGFTSEKNMPSRISDRTQRTRK